MDTAARKRLSRLISPYRVDDGRKFRLDRHDPADTGGLGDEAKDDAKAWLQGTIEWLAEEQEKLFAQDRWAVLLVFQAMDAAGKDSTIKHVLTGVNPQGCHVTSFKAPTSTELDHDFLWRSTLALPERGRIGIFNRSYYEEVLVVRVHRDILARQKLPPELVGKRIWKERLEDIAAYERYLSRNGVAIRKFFLNVSREEQARRFLERIDDPVTADNKWFTRTVVAGAIVDLMEGLGLRYPELDPAERQQLASIRERLAVPEPPARRRRK